MCYWLTNFDINLNGWWQGRNQAVSKEPPVLKDCSYKKSDNISYPEYFYIYIDVLY